MTTMNEQQQELNERIADDERHAATMRKARDYDALMARAEAAEAERNDANTEAARLKEAGRMVQEEVTAWRDSYEALNEQRLALAARVAELEAEAARLRQELEVQQGRAKTLLNRNSAQAARMRALLARAEAAEAEVVDLHRQLAEMAAAMEEIEDERLALAARVAELEAQLAAQGWRPVTEDWPPYGVQHLGRAMLDSPTMLVTRTTDDGDEVWQDTDGLLFYAGNIRYCAVIPPDATEARVAELEDAVGRATVAAGDGGLAAV
jgi:predicted  nucleic acid-binding Zn-ribbon protein